MFSLCSSVREVFVYCIGHCYQGLRKNNYSLEKKKKKKGRVSKFRSLKQTRMNVRELFWHAGSHSFFSPGILWFSKSVILKIVLHRPCVSGSQL